MLSRPWLLGFLEAQGSFSIVFKKIPSGLGYQVIPDFSVKVPLAQVSLLEAIQQELRIGHIYRTATGATLKATKLADAQDLIAFLEGQRFLSETRQRHFDAWKESVRLITQGTHRTKEGLLNLAMHRDLLTERKQHQHDYCHVRRDLDPCEHAKHGTLPKTCRRCHTQEK
ncbi:MAG: LAGLIDADG family homing endonuclease [Nanoarchaeota archaeon]|nr:LAGLIDADG family homing endonuclease [Nanoarchaeota archaeon]